MKLHKSFVTMAIFNLNMAIDSGKYNDFPYREVQENIENENIIPYFKEKLKGDVDLSLFVDEESIKELNANLLDVLHGVGTNRIRRKFGVENNGLCLAIALLTEVLQRMMREEEN